MEGLTSGEKQKLRNDDGPTNIAGDVICLSRHYSIFDMHTYVPTVGLGSRLIFSSRSGFDLASILTMTFFQFFSVFSPCFGISWYDFFYRKVLKFWEDGEKN